MRFTVESILFIQVEPQYKRYSNYTGHPPATTRILYITYLPALQNFNMCHSLMNLHNEKLYICSHGDIYSPHCGFR